MITIITGGQYGGEGKGKVAAVLASRTKYDVVCRTGGVNSCHTVVSKGRTWRLRMMPASSVEDKSSFVVFGAGSLIHIDTLLKEIDTLKYPRERILIDPLAGVVSEDCVRRQRQDRRYDAIGSTLTGTGYATAERALRKLKLAGSYPTLRSFIHDTRNFLYKMADRRKNILVEGHQGAGLSNYHGDYPYTSSRDCTAAALLSELGLGLGWSYSVYLVVKTYPTRNHAGKLYEELSHSEARILGISEFGGGSWGVADKERRVGVLNFDDLRTATKINTPNFIALTCVDYWDNAARGIREKSMLTKHAIDLVRKVELETGVPVGLISTGPDNEHVVWMNKGAQLRAGKKQKDRSTGLGDSQMGFDF